PGDPADVALVNRIYRMHYIEGLGCGRIARRLNDEGALGPEGGRWYNQRVSSILRNPAYTGRGLTNRETLARHYQRSTEGPQPTPLTPADMANRKRPRSK